MAGPVGRNSESDVVSTFLAAAASAPALLTIEGEAGIGKTTLCAYVLDRARDTDTVVLSCRPSAAESSMSFAGLTDLLSGVAEEMFVNLPTPQRHALAVATLREEPSGGPPDVRVIGTALQTILTTLAASRPVIVVIDDAHWLDRPTTDVVGFALRRVSDLPLGLLTSRRTGVNGGDGVTILDPMWQSSIGLEPLTSSALFHVVRDQLGTTLAHPALVRVAEASQGNPFVALELVRAGVDGATLPETLHGLSVTRLSHLSGGARETLLGAACMPRPTISRLAELGLRDHLDEAEAAGVVEVVDGHIEFTHPLLCAAAIEVATAPAKRAMHQRLAEQSRDPEESAHHRALATPGPDDGVAVALSAAAESSANKGASSKAAELALLALARTEDPTGESAWRRRVRAAELVYTSGDTEAAASLLDELDQTCPPGEVRARGWLLLTQVSYQTSSQHRTQECASKALADADDAPELRANALLSLSALAIKNSDRVHFASEARRCIDEGGLQDTSLLAWALCQEISARFAAGDGLDLEALDRALAVERAGRTWTSDDQVAAVRPVLLKWADRQADALDALAELEVRAAQEGNEGILPYALGHRSNTLLRMGRFDEAAAVAADHLFHADETGQGGQRIQALHNLAMADAHAGRLDLAMNRANEVLRWSEHEQDPWLEMNAAGVLGFVALSSDKAAEACQWFERWWRASQAEEVIDPGISRHHGDRIEALVTMGAIEEATELTDQLADAAARAGRVSVAAIAARCRAMIAAGTADPVSAMRHFDEALRLHAEILLPFDMARTLFVKGIAHRRAKEKRLSREALVRAQLQFRDLGAQTWEGRAEAELARIGSRPAGSLELTGSESRVAKLVASGLTNRQVAEQAFISPKTVEANLAKVYRKLGISSRAELGAHMARLADTE